jgi:hypothetical protein
MSEIHSVLFDKNYYDEKLAKTWLKIEGLHPIKKVHITENFLRYRIRDPNLFKRFITKEIPKDHVKLIIGYY